MESSDGPTGRGIPRRRAGIRDTVRLRSDPVPGTARRDSKYELTHRRLLRHAIEVIRVEGMAGVVPQRIARDLDLAPATFHEHFESVDHCLGAAAALVVSGLLAVDNQLRGHLSAPNLEGRAEHIERALASWMRERLFVQLALSQRLDPSAFGKCVRPVFEQVRSDVADVLRDYAHVLGASEEGMRGVEHVADAVHSQWLWGLEVLIDGRNEDIAAVAMQLADNIDALIIHGLRRVLGPSTAEVVEGRFTGRELGAMRSRQQLVQNELKNSPRNGADPFGGVDAVIDAVMNSIPDYFLPEIANGRCAHVLYLIEARGRTQCRLLIIEPGGCRWEMAEQDRPASLTLRMTLRTMLECTNGVRSYAEAVQTGDVVLAGDVAFALQLEGWFYIPGSAVDRQLARRQ